MPLQGSFEVEAGKIWGYYEPETRYILDAFTRPSGVLGISTNGQPWTVLAGTWFVNGNNQAQTNNIVTSGVGAYPLATYDLVDRNQLGYANVSPGMGIAFNIQNSGNWYAIAGYDTATSFSCNCQTCCTCNTCTYGCTTGPNCGQCGSTETGPFSTYPTCSPGCSVQGSVQTGYFCVCCKTCSYNCTTATSCPNCGQTCHSCNCQTCYNYSYYLTVLQSINDSVHTVSTVAISGEAVSISVETNNDTVSYYAYSTNISGIITQPNGLGTLLVSGTLIISGTLGTQIGMVRTPSYAISGTTISGFFGTGL